MTPNSNEPPKDISQFKVLVQLLWNQGLKEQARKYEIEAKKKGYPNVGSCDTEEILEKFITSDKDMLALKDDVRILQGVDDVVLIRGESGTGKEIIAQALHGSRGPYAEVGNIVHGRFVAINCPALSVDLMQSSLFGHKRGSFTGALTDKIGAFQYAYKGTLFIDEIGDMPLSMQASILRVLQEKVITPVGSNEDIKIECRIITATNKNLEKMVEDGKFRLDLLHRLNTFELYTKPLIDREDDVKEMIKLWDTRGGFKLNGELKGNCRELQSLIKRWNILGK
jgi:transcriptional regulator with GAF, ATPase, and Fis domain